MFLLLIVLYFVVIGTAAPPLPGLRSIADSCADMQDDSSQGYKGWSYGFINSALEFKNLQNHRGDGWYHSSDSELYILPCVFKSTASIAAAVQWRSSVSSTEATVRVELSRRLGVHVNGSILLFISSDLDSSIHLYEGVKTVTGVSLTTESTITAWLNSPIKSNVRLQTSFQISVYIPTVTSTSTSTTSTATWTSTSSSAPPQRISPTAPLSTLTTTPSGTPTLLTYLDDKQQENDDDAHVVEDSPLSSALVAVIVVVALCVLGCFLLAASIAFTRLHGRQSRPARVSARGGGQKSHGHRSANRSRPRTAAIEMPGASDGCLYVPAPLPPKSDYAALEIRPLAAHQYAQWPTAKGQYNSRPFLDRMKS